MEPRDANFYDPKNRLPFGGFFAEAEIQRARPLPVLPHSHDLLPEVGERVVLRHLLPAQPVQRCQVCQLAHPQRTQTAQVSVLFGNWYFWGWPFLEVSFFFFGKCPFLEVTILINGLFGSILLGKLRYWKWPV